VVDDLNDFNGLPFTVYRLLLTLTTGYWILCGFGL
jgi:hypothetical protein